MINIAIVDDNAAFLQEMKQDIEACKEFTADMACGTYCSGADFLQADCGACHWISWTCRWREWADMRRRRS